MLNVARLHIAVDMYSFPRWRLKVIGWVVPHPTDYANWHGPAMMYKSQGAGIGAFGDNVATWVHL
ncbi:hypothetical protein BFP75_00785 [Maribacter sp. 4G9]|nr:hypothetical protein BFP75_03845 [Maribacter sp. 4G9]PIB39166.1 hypothetical protein BFP75_12955 [Maribacter sp. 4G9]PIB39207.1 hypothetical protein BFP75_00785 [Maribacter sp. 4G9]